MFSQLHPAPSRRQSTSLTVSLVVHFVFLGWLLQSPKPIFVAPSAVMRGEQGASLTPIYFGGSSGITERAKARLTWPRSSKIEKWRRLNSPPPRMELGNELHASVSAGEHPAGSPYGSLAYGKFSGSEVRPALPISARDPVSGPEFADLQGDVIVEITIDEQGNIVQTTVLQSLGPAIDQKVLAALQGWHFRAATRDGVAIPSKQDVYYHFPR